LANIQFQVILRKDLKMPVGLAMAQATHVSDQWMRTKIINFSDNVVGVNKPFKNIDFSDNEIAWMHKPYVAILAVDCKEELEHVIHLAKAKEIPYSLWTDTIQLNIFENKFADVLIGCSLGPIDADKLSVISGCLPLY